MLMPTAIGYQDIASLIARQPAVAERWRERVLSAPFTTLHAATFSFPRPVGSAIPDNVGFQLASFDPRALDVTGSIPSGPPLIEPNVVTVPALDFPTVNRTHKGDLLVPRSRPTPPQVEPQPAKERDLAKEQKPAIAARPADQEDLPAAAAVPASSADTAAPDGASAPAAAGATDDEEARRNAERAAAEASTPGDTQPAGRVEDNGGEGEAGVVAARLEFYANENPATRMARLFFGPDAVAPARQGLEPWNPGEAPVLVAPPVPGNPDLKRSAVTPGAAPTGPEGQTIAPKGEVTGAGKRPLTPAERLGLTGKTRARHERCLADAIYFEARGESERGQKAVAQVVMNRVFSNYYPDNVCGVVYQNANRYLGCQFTFACEGKRLTIDEPDAWELAKRIARDTLDGKVWVPEVGYATHYHAYWVRPSWVHEMRRMLKLGVHTFYRPRAWGDGSGEVVWATAPAIAKAGATGTDATPAKTSQTSSTSAAAARM
jgi:spore germination cell wall hydrolase CwlJ-like protein